MHSCWSLICRAFCWGSRCACAYLPFNWSWSIVLVNLSKTDYALPYLSSRWIIRFSFSICGAKYICVRCIAHVYGVTYIWWCHLIWRQVLLVQEDMLRCVLNEDPLRLYSIDAFWAVCLCCFLNVIAWNILSVGQIPAFINNGAGASRAEVIGVILSGLQVGWAILVIRLEYRLTTLLLVLHLMKDLRSLATTWRHSSEWTNIEGIETSWILIFYSGFCSMMWNISFLLLRC